MADGWITIETKLATDKFDKQITNLEKKIKSEENKTELKLKAKLQAENELKRHKQAIFEIEKEYEKTSQQVEKLQGIMAKHNKGISLTPQDFTDLQSYEQISKENEKIGSTLDKMYAKEVKLNNAVEKTSLAYKQTQDNVQGYKTKIESIKINKQQAQVEQIKKGFSKVGNAVDTAVKKIGRMALGIFGVASAYRLMSSASSTLGQYDEQYATNLEYIRYLIAQAIAPALKYVVNLASTFLSYLNYIAKAWFNVTLFSKNSAKNFAKAQGSTSKIKKDLQTTPFDEMTLLSDTSAGGAGGEITTPSIDPSIIAGEVPEWLQWIANNKNLIINSLKAILATIALFKISKWLDKLGLFKIMVSAIKNVINIFPNLLKKIFSNANLIKNLGLVVMISGIVYAIASLIDLIKDPSWEKFGNVLIGIGATLGGIAIITGNVALGIAGLATIVGGTVIKFLNQESAIKDTKTAMEEYKKAVEETTNAEQEYVNAVDKAEEAQRKLTEAEKGNKLSGEQLYQSVQNGILDYRDMTSEQKEVYKAYLENKSAQNELKSATEKLTEAKHKEKLASLQNRLSLLAEKGDYEGYKEAVVDAYNQGEISADEARTAIEQAMADMSNSSRKTFRNDLPADINNGLNPDRYRTQGNALVEWANELGNQIKKAFTLSIDIVFNAPKNIKTVVEGNKALKQMKELGFATGGIINIPKCARGSVINLPGSGIPIGGGQAIGGEAGAEGVIPLTDSQVMSRLGAEIGRNVIINATILNSMNGRVISRQLQRIQNDSDFGYNT